MTKSTQDQNTLSFLFLTKHEILFHAKYTIDRSQKSIFREMMRSRSKVKS